MLTFEICKSHIADCENEINFIHIENTYYQLLKDSIDLDEKLVQMVNFEELLLKI
jgi:4-hydroxyphenylpyruvate dioxygenase-like putative hemolysin